MINNIKHLLTDLIRGKTSIFVFPQYILLKYFGFPDLQIQWLQTIRRLSDILLKRYPYQVYAFTSFDLWLRSYYAKLARNFREVGRYGYVWEDSLGFPMGSRFGSNLVTYLIYGSLSSQVFGLLTLILFLASVFLVGVLNHQVLLGVIIIVLLVPSPTVVFSLVAYRIKPEMIWWAVSILSIYFALIDQWRWAWVTLSFLLLVNTTVSFFVGALLGGIWLWGFLTGTINLDFDLLWLVPGLSFRLWRFGYAYFDGNLIATVREQRATNKKQKSQGKWIHSSVSTLSYGIWKILFPLLIASGSQWKIGLILAGTIFLLYILNSVLFKVADIVTFQIVILNAAVTLTLFSGAWIGLVAIFWTANMLPYTIAWNIKGRKQRESLLQSYWHPEGRFYSARIVFYKRLSRDYPWLSAKPFPKPPALMELFDFIPECSRLLMESDDNAREGGQFTRFRDWTNEFLPQRQVEFVNHTFMNRMLEPGLTNKYLSQFNHKQLSGATLQMVCDHLGVSYVLASTDGLADSLGQMGWKKVASVLYDDFAELADLLFMPETNLTLLANPHSTGVISPNVNWTRNGNQITWESGGAAEYLLRYRFHPSFAAHIGNSRLSLEPYCPLEDIPLTFMRVETKISGKITLTFSPKIFNKHLAFALQRQAVISAL